MQRLSGSAGIFFYRGLCQGVCLAEHHAMIEEEKTAENTAEKPSEEPAEPVVQGN